MACLLPRAYREEKNKPQTIYIVLLPIRKITKALQSVLKNFSEVPTYDSNSHPQLHKKTLISILFHFTTVF